MNPNQLQLRDAAIRRLFQAMEHGECAKSIADLAATAYAESVGHLAITSFKTEMAIADHRLWQCPAGLPKTLEGF